MTTGNPRRSVLVIGASQRVLDDCVAALRDLGYAAQGTNDFSSDITGRFDVANIDLVSLGHLIPPDRKAELKEQIGVRPAEWFATVQVGAAIYNFSIAAGQLQQYQQLGHARQPERRGGRDPAPVDRSGAPIYSKRS